MSWDGEWYGNWFGGWAGDEDSQPPALHPKWGTRRLGLGLGLRYRPLTFRR